MLEPDEEVSAEEEEKGPTELNTRSYGNFLEVSPDKISVRYYGQGAHANDVGAIQANRPVPSSTLVYYFELDVKDAGERGCVAIGFTDNDFKLSRQPGWEANSYGYHGDDGQKFHESGSGEEYGPSFTTGDTVGAGIHLGKQEIFFTKNGKNLGVAFRNVSVPLIPSIGLHSRGEQAVVNFGQRPFAFDLEAMVAEEREQHAATLGDMDVQPGVVHKIVRSYLLHYGYAGTLRAFDAASGGVSQRPAQAEVSGEQMLESRMELRQMVLEGNVDGAVARLRAEYPSLLEEGGDLHFYLACQKFVELIARGEIDAAAAYAQEELYRLRNRSPRQDRHLEDVVALIAYEDPAASPVGRLIGVRQREAVADAINAAVLGMSGGGGGGGSKGFSPGGATGMDEGENGAEEGGAEEGAANGGGGGGGGAGAGHGGGSVLEVLLRQLVTVQEEARASNGGQGEIFRLRQLLSDK